MWKPLSLDPPYFILFLEENRDSYYIGVTNFHQYWSIYTTRSQFLTELKQANDGIEFEDDNDLLETGLDMIKNPYTLKSVRMSQKDLGEKLHVIMSKVFEFTFRLEMSLLRSGHQTQFDMMIQPLLQTLCDLHSSEKELRELLLKKDKEIEEYKIEGKAPRRLITTLYNDAEHMKKHTTYEQFFSASKVPELLKVVAYSSHSERKSPLLSALVSSSKTTTSSSDTNSNIELSQNSKATTDTLSNINTSESINNIPSVSVPDITLENMKETTSVESIKNLESESIHKIEKTSQNSLMEDENQISVTNIEEKEMQLPKDEVKPSEIISPARKRQKKRLNY